MYELHEYIKKNKRKFLYIGLIISSSYGIYKTRNYIRMFTEKHLNDANLDFKILKAQYFQFTLINSLDTIKAIFINVGKDMESIIDSENVATDLGIISNIIEDKDKYSLLSNDTKLELWKKLKVLCFTKFTILIYYLTFIYVSIHIQMSILAGYLFKIKYGTSSSFYQMIVTYYKFVFHPMHGVCIDNNFQTGFIKLSLSQVKAKLSDLMILVHKVSSEIIGPISLKKMLSSDDILKIFSQIQGEVHNNILELFLHDIQIQKSTVNIESNVYGLYANVFESGGIENINSLITILSRELIYSIDIKLRSKDNNIIYTQFPLAKFVPFIWTYFIGDNNETEILNEFCQFSSHSQFRYMLFSSFESAMSFK